MKHYVRLCRPRFEVTVLEIDAKDTFEAGIIARENAGSLPESVWHLQAFDAKSYQPHVEERTPQSDVEANVGQEPWDKESFIKELRSTEATEHTRYMLLQADINGGDGEVVYEPWFDYLNPTLLEIDIVGDWLESLTTVEDRD